jgi:hypothetical protein
LDWEAGQTIVDHIAIPIQDSVPTGMYTVRVSLIDAGSRTRWRLADGRETLEVGTVRVGSASRAQL